MGIIASFFFPYIQFLHGAAYNVQQTLEGLGVTSSYHIIENSNSVFAPFYWSADENVLFIFSILCLYSIALVIFIFLAAYVLARIIGIIIALTLLLIPGVVSIFGLISNLHFLPETYVFNGTGVLGSGWGSFPLFVIGILTGWSLTILFVDLFDLKDRFRHYYDHIWYTMALLSGIFFIADSNTQYDIKILERENLNSQQTSTYLLNQVRDYYSECQKDSALGAASCHWVSRVQQRLSDYSMFGPNVFHKVGPQSSAEIYSAGRNSILPTEIRVIRQEIMNYNNNRCSVEVINNQFSKIPLNGVCQIPPGSICSAFADPFEGKIKTNAATQSVSLASECAIPTLVRSRKIQEKYAAIVSNNAKNKHYRWSFYILFSVFAGVKVANATARAAELDKREAHEKMRLSRLVKVNIEIVISSIKFLAHYTNRIICRLTYITRK